MAVDAVFYNIVYQSIAYHSASKEARESKLIWGGSSQFYFSGKLVIAVFKHVN